MKKLPKKFWDEEKEKEVAPPSCYVPTSCLHHWRIYSSITYLLFSQIQMEFLKMSWSEIVCYVYFQYFGIYIFQNCPFSQDLSVLLMHQAKESQSSHSLVGDSTVHLKKQRPGILFRKNRWDSSGRGILKSSVIVRNWLLNRIFCFCIH